jgi:CMP-N-acetylneuraminic acid synthetase
MINAKKNLKILGVTLARGGSKSIPNKNIKNLNGNPLISYTIKEALKSKYLTDYIVSTDSTEIIDVANKFGAKTPFVRPKELSEDSSSSSSALAHALDFMEELNGHNYDYLIEIMCTNPLKNVVDIDSVIRKLIHTDADSVIAVHKLEDHHPARIKKIVDDRIVDFCINENQESRRQDLKPDAYIRSGSIYGLKRNYFKKTMHRYGSYNSRPYILPPDRSINIDTIADFYLAEYYLTRNESLT